MPHLIDPDTGLCTICKKSQIAAINEGRKYKRHGYDVRKAVVERMTHQEDPNYHIITDRHYVREPVVKSQPFSHRVSNASYRSYSKAPFTPRSIDTYDEEDEEVRRIEANSRANIRKANIQHASRLGILPPDFQGSEPNIVYVPSTSKSKQSPRYIVVNDDNNNYNSDRTIYVDGLVSAAPPLTSASTTSLGRKKKVVIHHHYEDPNAVYSVFGQDGSVIYQVASADDLNYQYQYY